MLSLVIATLQGCLLYPIIGPGYSVDIYVKDPNFKRENTTYLEEIAIRENFVRSHEVEEPDWYAIYYLQIPQEKRGFINLIISYDQKDQLLSVLVINAWTGQEMKREIDSVADLYITALGEVYGKENLSVVRKRTGPPTM